MINQIYKIIRISVKILLGGFFLAGLYVLLTFFYSRLIFPDNFKMFEIDDKIKLAAGEPVTQFFLSTKDNLSQINLLVGNLDKLLSNEKFTVSILDSNCENVIRNTEISELKPAPRQLTIFLFDPILDSREKIYCLKILYESQEDRDNHPYIQRMKKIYDNPYYFFINQKTGEKHNNQTLIFRPAYKEKTPGETIAELIRRIGAYKASYLKGLNLYIIFISFFVLTVILVFLLVLL